MLLFGVMLFMISGLQAQIPDSIVIGLKSGNAKTLAQHLNQNVELVILERENVCSKAQAEQILKDFFSKHKPSAFRVIHQGGKEGARYAIGNLEAGNGSYRVYFLLKQKGSKPLIHQLRIEKE